MYRTFDEDVFLAPESIVSGVLSAAAFDDDLEFPDVESLAQPWEIAAPGLDPDSDAEADGRAETDGHAEARATGHAARAEPVRSAGNARHGDAWSRHASAANGFGG